MCMFVRHHSENDHHLCSWASQTPLYPCIIWKLMTKAIQKSQEDTNTKTKKMTNTTTKTKTQIKCLLHPIWAIFLRSWWLIHSKYDDRYLTLVTLATLVTLFQSYNQFYRGKCITVLGSSFWQWKLEDQFENTLYIFKPLVELQKELTITSSNMALLGKTGPFQEQHFN